MKAWRRCKGAWERLKTIDDPNKAVPNKKLGITKRLSNAAPDPRLFARLETEALELTEIGNKCDIRHKEVDKIPIRDVRHVDYLFHRLFALIYLLLTDE